MNQPRAINPGQTEMDRRLEDIRAQRKARSRLRWPLPASHRGRRLLALLAAITIPAMSMAAEWNNLDIGRNDAGDQEVVEPMPFEQPGQSFPGSAFYFLEDTPRIGVASVENNVGPLFDMTGTGELDAQEQLVEGRAGPAARAFLSSGSRLSRGRALDCMTKAVYYEAASEALGGQRAVAQVVLNRVAHPSYPNSVCGVVFQGSQRRTGCQFSFTCDGSLRRKPGATAWARARMVARDALAGKVYTPVGLATHYHTVWIYPYWASSLNHIGTIGAHRFYRWRGSAGKPGAFRARYAGAEPAAVWRARADNLPLATEAADPLALAREYERTFTESKQQAETHAAQMQQQQQNSPRRRMPPPVYSNEIQERGGDEIFKAENLPDASGVKEEYRNSGRWIAEPGAPVNTN